MGSEKYYEIWKFIFATPQQDDGSVNIVNSGALHINEFFAFYETLNAPYIRKTVSVFTLAWLLLKCFHCWNGKCCSIFTILLMYCYMPLVLVLCSNFLGKRILFIQSKDINFVELNIETQFFEIRWVRQAILWLSNQVFTNRVIVEWSYKY